MNKEINAENESIGLLTRQAASYSTNMEFGLTSPKVSQAILEDQAKQLAITKQVSEYLCSEHVPVDDHGRRLINCDESKRWFYTNITFVFATGFIFDEEDTKRMDAVLGCFVDKPNRAYLNNSYHLLNYDDELVMALEKTIGITNGNYHILMAVLNAADDEQLKIAPSVRFKHSGITKITTKWTEIENMIAEYVSNYGFIFEYHDRTDVNSFKNQQRLSRENYFNSNPSQNVLDLFQTKVEKIDPVVNFNARENMRVGRAFGQHQRGDPKDAEQDFRMKSGNDLYSRIANDHLQSLTSRTKGGVLKMNLYQMQSSPGFGLEDGAVYRKEQPEAKQSEYILYPGADAYSISSGDNVAPQANPMIKSSMPKIATPNYKAQRMNKKPIAQPQFPK